MQEEKSKELIAYMSSLGFVGSKFEQDIEAKLESGATQFNIEYEALWGKEKMLFDLKFQFDHQFKAHRLEFYKATHINEVGLAKSGNFRPSAYGTCNCNLSYFSLSGRLADLSNKLSYLGLEEFPGVDVHSKLEKMLSHNPNEFTLKYTRNEPEGFIEYMIPVSKIDSWYYVENYQATLVPYPEIKHGIFNGINTKDFEQELKGIDWHKTWEHFVFQHDGEIELLQPAGDILRRMNELCSDPEGDKVADLLKLKYWSDADYFEGYISDELWSFYNVIPKRTETFPTELEAKAAFNLLCGRAVLFRNTMEGEDEHTKWMQLNFEEKQENGSHPMKYISGYSTKEIENLLYLLPTSKDNIQGLLRELLTGARPLVNLNNGGKIYLQANPEKQKIDFFSEDMRPIQLNLKFDPDWKPVTSNELKLPDLKRGPKERIIRSNKNFRFRRRR